MTKPVVLFIDDDEIEGLSTFQKLMSLGFVPRFHRGPFGTLAAIRDTRCQLVLLDVNMPNLDGPSLVRVIRHTYSNLPIVLHSNMERSVLERICKYVGADGVVTKDMDPEAFARTLRGMLVEVDGRTLGHAKACC